MSGRVLAHGIRAVFSASFDAVANAVRGYDEASNIYFTVLNTSPRVAVAYGQKYFFRVGQYISCVTLVIERGSETEVRIIAHSGLKALSFGDYGASAAYAREVLGYLSNALNVSPRDVVEVDYMDVTKSQLLG
ncbi:hypothetical protein [Vulcanisaeta sp. JCM 14467]